MLKHAKHGLFLLVLITLLVPSTMAYPNYVTNFEQQYPSAVGSKLDSCLLCHNSQYGGSRNPYGVDFKNNGFSFTNIEQIDSDGDEHDNLEEITSLTYPGVASDYPPTLTTITLSPLTASILIGQSQQFTATTLDQNGDPISGTLTWSTSDPNVATINTNGNANGVSEGTVTVSATSGIGSGTATLTVNSPSPPSQSTVTRTLSKNYIQLGKNPSDSVAVTLTGTGADFELYNVKETIPMGLTVTLLPNQPTVFLSNSGNLYMFIGIQGITPIQTFTLQYSITDSGVQHGNYDITGTFADADKQVGTISPSNIRVINYIWELYDTNGDGEINKEEVITAIVDYFENSSVSFGDIVSVVEKYFGL